MINYLLLVIFLLIYSALGCKLLGYLAIKDFPAEEKTIFSLALGLGTVSLLLFSLGCLGLLYGWIIGLLFVVISIFSIREFVPASRNLASAASFLYAYFRKKSVLLILLLLLLFGFILINFLSSLVFTPDYDSLSYHLFTPKKYLAHHSIYPMPDSFQSYWSLALEMVYIPFLLLGRPELAGLLSFVISILIIYLIIIFINKYISQNPLVGALAALLYYDQPYITLLSTTPKNDLAFAFFSLLILFSLFNWYHEDNNKWLWLAAIFLGLTVSIKLTGMLFFPIFFVGLFIALLYKKNKSTCASSYASAFLTACAFSFLAFLPLLPWLAKTYLWTGYPFYPFLTSFNGHKYTFIGGHDKTFLQYLQMFWDVTFNCNKFMVGWDGPLPPYFLAIFPMLIVIRKQLTKKMISLLLISLVFITFLFFTGFGIRYLLPAIVLLSIILAFAYFSFLEKQGWVQKTFITVVLLFFFCIDLLISCQLFMNSKLPVICGLEKRIDYLSRLQPISLATFVNNNLPPKAKIFSPHNSAGYYFDQEFISGFIEFSRYYEDFEQVKSIPEAVLKLKKMGVTHLSINTQFLDGWWRKHVLFIFYSHKVGGRNPFANPFYRPEIKDWLDRNCECVYSDPNTFNQAQFFNQIAINRLLEAINNDNYGIDKLKSLEQLNTLLTSPDWLAAWSQKKKNRLLGQGIIPRSILEKNISMNRTLLAKFFDNPTEESLVIKYDQFETIVKLACQEKDNLSSAKKLVETLQPFLLLKGLVKEIASYPKNNLAIYQQNNISKLNRLTIELTYPTLCPSQGSTIRSDHFFLYKL
ncbi:MAG: glycosyltransferase family 39 protein [bacterium]